MPRKLPGARDAGINEPRLSVAFAQFTEPDLEVLKQFVDFWAATMEQGARPFVSPLSAHLSLPELRAFWPLSSVDENDVLYDLSGQARHLTHNGTPDRETVNFTPIVHLHSANTDYLSRAHEAGLDLTADFSLGLWLKIASGSGDALVMGKTDGGSNICWGIQLDNTANTPRYRFHVSETGSTSSYSQNTPASVYSWHLLVGVHDASYAPILYVDGDAPTALPTGLTTGALHSSAAVALTIGHEDNAASSYLDAYVALPFVTAGALSQNTIRQLFAATRELFT